MKRTLTIIGVLLLAVVIVGLVYLVNDAPYDSSSRGDAALAWIEDSTTKKYFGTPTDRELSAYVLGCIERKEGTR